MEKKKVGLGFWELCDRRLGLEEGETEINWGE